MIITSKLNNEVIKNIFMSYLFLKRENPYQEA